MKGRETKGAPSSADLLVCLPSRSRLTLMPKPICSPTRPSESNKHRHNNQHHLHYHRRLLKTSSTRKGCGAGSHASPLLWAENKQTGPEIMEPTSPKVTCAGQIKVSSKTSSCKNWQSVMENIENVHRSSRHRKRRASWVESLGFKKVVRGIRFEFRCFGSFDIISEDEDEDENEEGEEYQDNQNHEDGHETSRTIFSKWIMVLQENHDNETMFHDLVDDDQAAIPPPNALLLLRCRSAPAKARQEENEENEEDAKEEKKTTKLKPLMEEKNRKKEESLVVMGYDCDSYKISTDIVKETWVVGGTKDPLSRCRSWKS